MICIISGPSCAGKSTFLQSTQVYPITNLPSIYPVVFPASIPNHTDVLQDGCFVHYNTLRVADRYYRNPDKQIESLYNFTSDPSWNEIRNLSVPRKAIVLLASRTVLEKRMSSRKYIEPKKLIGRSPSQYPVNHWMEVLNGVDLHELYAAWCSELKQIGITYTMINSASGDYEILRQNQLKYLRLNT